MNDRLILCYILIFLGLLDFIVVPRLLIYSWKKKGKVPEIASKLVLLLRISGLILIILAFLLKYGKI